MNTLLALTITASAYGFVVTILLLNQKARRKQAEVQLKVSRRYNDDAENDRDQLAQALKETQSELATREVQCLELENRIDKLSETINHTKVRRDPKTGRMVSAKSK